MGYHIRASVDEGFRVSSPHQNIEVILRDIIKNGDKIAFKVQVYDSPLIKTGTFREMGIDSALELANDTEVTIRKYHPISKRLKFYIDKPADYKVFPIK
ncbi:hypothetical protein HYW20_02910 [Candidatus Woesearchaeota archaeon]|nr:hypothetical protein [Candidatus Woesearchaeota archaeon]